MSEAVKITKKIVGYRVVTPEEQVVDETIKPLDNSIFERIDSLKAKAELKRPRKLNSETYRLKPTHHEHAIYVHISDIIHEGKKHPFECFFSCKNPTNIMWVSTISLLLSEAFREAITGTNNLPKIINNLKEVCDASGGYFASIGEKKKHVGSIVAEIGYILENHVQECNAWNYSQSSYEKIATEEEEEEVGIPYNEPVVEGYPPNATICVVCGVKAVVILDGCKTCLDCGDSKCG
jgi:hypothetical protein